jgi:hypothetical protein
MAPGRKRGRPPALQLTPVASVSRVRNHQRVGPAHATHGPCARRTIFSAFRAAALELWSEDGLRQVASHMSKECADETVDTVVIVKEWLPEDYVMQWYGAAWEGPAHRDRQAFLTFIDRMMDHGFGRVRKFLISFASVQMAITKVPELWRHDHTHGSVSARLISDREYVATLVDHVYITTPISRLAITEIYRHATSMFRGIEEPVASHSFEPNRLDMRVSWK